MLRCIEYDVLQKLHEAHYIAYGKNYAVCFQFAAFLPTTPTTQGATVYHPSEDSVAMAEPTSYQPTDDSMREPTSYQPTDDSMREPTSYQPTDESMDYKPTIYQGGIDDLNPSYLSSLKKQVPEEEFELKFKEG